jgi:hypothetical protein
MLGSSDSIIRQNVDWVFSERYSLPPFYFFHNIDMKSRPSRVIIWGVRALFAIFACVGYHSNDTRPSPLTSIVPL